MTSADLREAECAESRDPPHWLPHEHARHLVQFRGLGADFGADFGATDRLWTLSTGLLVGTSFAPKSDPCAPIPERLSRKP